MEIELAEQHIYLLTDRLTATDVQQRAMDRRTGAFGSGIGSLLQRPKAEERPQRDPRLRVPAEEK